LGRFAQADNIVPNKFDSQAFDRYAYVFNSPVKYIDPSGHRPACDNGSINCDEFKDWIKQRKLVMKSPSELTLSENGLDFIMKWEHFSQNPYNDALNPFKDEYYWDRTGKGAGNCTGGYGHKIHNKQCDGRPEEDVFVDISPEKALEILKNDVYAAEEVVKQNVNAPLTQTQYDALVSLCFNFDCVAHPSKINLINAGHYVYTGLHFLEGPIDSKGEIMEGLVKRRYAEAVMFLTGYNITLPTLEEYLADPLNVDLLP
jgi:GH24 family phage-related lysozyme (muramidase)